MKLPAYEAVDCYDSSKTLNEAKVRLVKRTGISPETATAMIEAIDAYVDCGKLINQQP